MKVFWNGQIEGWKDCNVGAARDARDALQPCDFR